MSILTDTNQDLKTPLNVALEMFRNSIFISGMKSPVGAGGEPSKKPHTQ